MFYLEEWNYKKRKKILNNKWVVKNTLFCANAFPIINAAMIQNDKCLQRMVSL